MEEQWINELRKKMASHQTPIPSGLWEGIDNAMKEQTKVAPRSSRRLWKYTTFAAVAAAIALFFVLPIFYEQNEVNSLPHLSHEQNQPLHVMQDVEVADAMTSQPKLNATTRPPQDLAPLLAMAQSTNHEKAYTTTEKAESSIEKVRETKSKSNTKSNKNQLVGKDRKASNVTSFRKRQLSSSTSTKLTPKAQKSQPKNHHIDLQIYLGNGLHTAHQTDGYGEFVRGTALPQWNAGHLPHIQTPEGDLIYGNLSKKISTHKKHHIPIEVGFSINYRWAKRWGIESGLAYAYLSSSLTSGSTSHYFETNQSLHYLKIPLNLQFDFWQPHWGRFYITTGGALAKCIGGKATTNYTIDYHQLFQKENNIMEKELQWSINAALGAQVHFTPHIGLYAEPGINYYFNNHSGVENSYKDQPLNFNFKVGLRISLP